MINIQLEVRDADASLRNQSGKDSLEGKQV